jgi:ATP-binding cassette subfamily C protein/ATP-binding cassette subfamily C protein LapB
MTALPMPGSLAPLDDGGKSWKRLNSFVIGGLTSLAERGDLAACLPGLLTALEWKGSPRLLAEMLPSGDDRIDLTDFLNLLRRLGYEGMFSEERMPGQIAEGDLPCMVLPENAPAYVVLAAEPKRLQIFRPGAGEVEWMPRRKARGELLLVGPDAAAVAAQAAQPGAPINPPGTSWFRLRLLGFKKLMWLAVGLTVAANFLGLSVSIYTMAVYDVVIGAHAPETLLLLAAGAIFGSILELAARRLRTRTMTYAGAKISLVVGNAIFGRLVSLPAMLTERASISAQIARIKDLERVRDLMTGPIAQSAIDLPFVIIFLSALFIIGGPIAFVPLVAILIYILMAIGFSGMVNRSVSAAAKVNASRQELVLEIIEKMRILRLGRSGDIMLKRYREQNDEAVKANHRSALISASIQQISYFVTMAAGLSTIVAGIHFVLAGQMTAGALIGSTMLVWRVLQPVQGAFIALSRMKQLGASIQQIDSLMNLSPERLPGTVAAPIARVDGRVAMARVTFRYGRETDPVLANINFDIQPGEMVALIGRSGAGKSTLVKLLTGLYQTPVGSVRIDDRDLRQYDPLELRHVIGYVPQRPQIFNGTVADNIRFAVPLVTDEGIWEALRAVGAEDDVKALADGIDTVIDTRNMNALPTSLVVRLSIARAFAKKSRILLLDDPVSTLDDISEQAFMASLEKLRGQATIVLVTHRPSHIRKCDKVLILEAGLAKYFGPLSGINNAVILESI